MPGPTSIYHLWKAFDINSNVGGACGEIVALKGKYGRNMLNPLGELCCVGFCGKVTDFGTVAAQNFEYKMSNILGSSLVLWHVFLTLTPPIWR